MFETQSSALQLKSLFGLTESLGWLHHRDLMVTGLATSVMVARAVNRFAFGNHAAFVNWRASA